MQKINLDLLLIGSILASLGGFAGFIILFIPDFNIFRLILAPVIIACYQIPAVVLFGLHKKKKQKLSNPDQEEPNNKMKGNNNAADLD